MAGAAQACVELIDFVLCLDVRYWSTTVPNVSLVQVQVGTMYKVAAI